MNPYIDKLIQELSTYEARCEHRIEVSASDMLWDYYISNNSPDDGRIKQATAALRPVHRALPLNLSDELSNLVADLVYAYHRSAFLEGIRIGMHLRDEPL